MLWKCRCCLATVATASLANTSSLPSICRPNLIIWLNSDRARAKQFSVRDHRFLNLQTIVSALRCRKHKSKIKEESFCTKISPISYCHLLITVNANKHRGPPWTYYEIPGETEVRIKVGEGDCPEASRGATHGLGRASTR